MSAVAEAERTVRRARTRLAARTVLDGAARGGVVGAVAGLAVAAVALVVAEPWPALVALPAAGALLGSVIALRRRPSADAAALELDRAARTDEAFVTALTAHDAEPWARDLTAERAVATCPPARLRTVLPIGAPAAAAAAAVSTALLAAVVLVPRGGPARVLPDAPRVVVPSGGGAAGGPSESPGERVGAMAAAASRGDDAEAARLRNAVRGDLGAVPDADLRRLAEALAGRGSAEAKRALEALARGDRGAAVDALRAALGARDAGTNVASAGGETAGAVPGPAPSRPRSWGGGSWPLRYDSAIRRYFEEQR
jgi:hypothetical protein